jgi:osmotically-inducible protein OsmY
MATTSPDTLLTDINAALASDTRLDIEQLSVGLNSDSGHITLDGRVADIMMKRLAANAVRSVAGDAHPVQDRLRLRARVEGQLELRDEVVKLLAAESMFSDHTLIVEHGGNREIIHQGTPDAYEMNVQVENGLVTLSGRTMSLSHRRFAEVLIWWTPGCERVDNRLQVDPPEEDTDDEITDVVRMVLEKDPLVHASQLSVGTAGEVVEIRGLVASDEERRLAALDAWYVPGVREVIDKIEVSPTITEI